MFALDLFNTDHERRLAEGAVDQLEQRRIDDLAMRMDDLVARAKKADTPEAKQALIKEFQRCKDERDSYFKIKDECMGYGTLGEQDLDEGLGDSIKLAWVKALAWLGDKALSISKDPALKDRAKELLAQQTAKIEQMMLNTIAGHPREEELKKLIHYVVTQLNQQQTIGDFMRVLATLGKQFKTEREKFSEAEKNQDIADKEWLKKMGREPQGPLDKSIETAKQAARWVAGKGGPGKEGPTYESVQKKNLVNKRIDLTESRTYKLWEAAGQKIVEYKLTPDQIQQLFQQVEQGATAAGGNRTMIGQGKDVADAVGRAWNDLLGKVQNSGPIKNVDAAYDQVAAKLKQATGGDAGVMKYVEKYRAFAKKHPIAQSLIYAALIGALSISSAGVGGAAALGLLKMTDRLLQGDKFSSAVGKGVVAGALGYGAHQLMQYFMSPDVPVPPKTEVNLPDGEIYIVKPGDTMSGIAKATGNSVKDLVDVNQGQSIDMSPDGWKNPLKSAFSSQDALGNHIPDSGEIPNIEKVSDLAGRNLDRINPGEKLFVPHGPGTDVYAGGVGTNAQTIADIAAGKVPVDPISIAQYLKFHPGSTYADAMAAAGQGATTAGQAATNAATTAASGNYDAIQNAATNALASTQSPSQWTNTAGQKIASAGNLPDNPDAINRLAQYGRVNPNVKNIGLRESYVDRDLTVYTWALNESIGLPRGGVQLTNEGIGSMFKSAASKVGQWAQRTGHNLTTRVTADKLQKAWQKEGYPTDSDEIAVILQKAGVTPEIVNQIYAAMRIPAPKQAGAQPSTPAADAGQAGAEQPAQATKKHTGGRVAGAGPSQTPNAIRQRQARAAQKNPTTTSAAPATAGAGVFGQMAKDLSTTGTSSTGGMTQATPTGLRHTANPNNPNMARAATAPTPAPATTAPAVRPNYGAQTGAGAKVTYNQPTNVQYPNVNALQPAAGPKTSKATTPAATAPGQTITVGGQKIKPGDPLYNKLANAPIKEPASAVAETAGQRLHAGDPVVVTAPNEFEGATGEIYELSPSGSFVIVNLYNHGKHSMHLSDVEYNQYADDEDEDDWYDDEDLDESNMKRMLGDLNDISDADFQTQYGRSKDYWRKRIQTPTASATNIQDIESDDLSQVRTKPTFDRTGQIVKTRRTPVQQSMKRMLGTPKNVRPTPALEPVSVSLRVLNRRDGYDLLPAKIFNSEADAREFARRTNATILDIKPVLDEKKLGQNRPKLGSARDIGRSVKKFRAARGLDEEGVDENHATFYRVGKLKPKFQYGTEAQHGLYGPVQIGHTDDDGRVQIHYQRNGKNYSHPVDPDTLNRAGNEVEEGYQDFTKKEPYEVCLAGKCVKTFDYYEDARRFHDNWKKKLYNQGDKAKADKITLNPVMKEQGVAEEEQKPAGWGEFPPPLKITIDPLKKLKSGETYQDRNKYLQSQGQAPIYKTNEAEVKTIQGPHGAVDVDRSQPGRTVVRRQSKTYQNPTHGNPATSRMTGGADNQLDQIEQDLNMRGNKFYSETKAKGVIETDDWDDGGWNDMPDAHATVKAKQPARYPEAVLRAIERNPAMRADIIADYKRKEQGVAEGHADQQRRVFKKNGEPVGEVGIDRESSPGVGQYYIKHYASGKDLAGYDSYEEAVAELKHCLKQGVAEDGSNYQQQLSRPPAPNAVGSRYQKDLFATPQQSLAQQTNLKTGATPPVKWKKLNTTTAQDLGVRVDGQYVPAPNGGITVKGMATSYDNKTQYSYALTIDADHQIRYKNVDKLNDDELDAVFQNLASNGLLDRKYINPLKAQIQEEKNKEKDTIQKHAQDQEYLRKNPILNYSGGIDKVRGTIKNAKRKNPTAKNDVEAMFAQIGDESRINQNQENLINQLSQRLDQADAVNQQQSDLIVKLSNSLKQTSAVPRQPAAQQQQQTVSEESTTSSEAVERAVLNRIMVAHTDLLMKFGPEKVMQAVEEVAYGVGDVDEIGTSDVSAWVNQVQQILGVEA